jgi:hypothetical protein
VSLATRSLRNGAEGSGGPLGASGEGTTGGGATAQGAVAFFVASVVAVAAEEFGADAEGNDPAF